MKRYLASFLAYTLSLVLLSNMAQGQSSIEKAYAEAVRAYKAKEYNTYLLKVKEVEKALPNRPFILRKLASAYALTGNTKAALAQLQKLVWLQADPEFLAHEDFASIKHKGKFKKILKATENMLTPINESAKAFELPSKDFHPEGLAYDPATESFYCGSIRKKQIIKIDRTGKTSMFIPTGQDSLLSVSGLKVDPHKRVLWVTTGAIEQMEGFTEEMLGTTGVFKYDLDEGTLLKKYMLPSDGKPHYFGDLSIHPITNDVYVTDSYSSNIYMLNKQKGLLEKFTDNAGWKSLQGLDFSEDGTYLFVADYRTNIYRITIATKEVNALIAPKNTFLIGVDGLYFYKNSIVAIHNGIHPFRVVEYILDDDLLTVKKYDVLEQATPELNEPTLGVFHGNEFFYIANSPWAAYNRKGEPLEDKLQKGIILKVRLWETGESLQKQHK